MRRILMLFFMVFATGCTSSTSSPNEGSDVPVVSDEGSAVDEGCFWCVDTSAADMVYDTGMVDKGDQGKGDEKGLFVLWMGAVDLEEGVGTFSYEVYEEKDPLCSISYTMDALSEVEDCAGCDFAWAFTLGDEPTVDDPESLCAKGLGAEGESYSFGHSGSGELFLLGGDSWTSVFGGSELSGTSWSFYWFGMDGGKDDGEGKGDGDDKGDGDGKGDSDGKGDDSK